jgi:hypothetical protein
VKVEVYKIFFIETAQRALVFSPADLKDVKGYYRHYTIKNSFIGQDEMNETEIGSRGSPCM